MVTKRQILETFGEERDGKTVVVCPTCPDTVFESLEQWKDHMTTEHGGYTTEEVSEGLGASSSLNQSESFAASDDATRDKGARKDTLPPTKPKRLSARARELNDKCNRCVALILKHFMKGLSQEEQQELDSNRTDLTQAFVGIEFDFEERLFSLQGKWAIIVVLILLYAAPVLPNLKTIGEKIQAKAKSKEQKK